LTETADTLAFLTNQSFHFIIRTYAKPDGDAEKTQTMNALQQTLADGELSVSRRHPEIPHHAGLGAS
jgi:hypothetical protein